MLTADDVMCNASLTEEPASAASAAAFNLAY